MLGGFSLRNKSPPMFLNLKKREECITRKAKVVLNREQIVNVSTPLYSNATSEKDRHSSQCLSLITNGELSINLRMFRRL